MAKRRKIMTSRDQEKLLEDFYDQLDNDTLFLTEIESNDKIFLYVISKVYEVVIYFAFQRQYFTVIISYFTFSNV